MNILKIPHVLTGEAAVGVGDISLPGVKIIKPYYEEVLPPALRLHGDLTFVYLGEGVAVCAPESYEYYKKAFEGLPIELIKGGKSLGGTYPDDCAYNVATVGKRLFGKVEAADAVLIKKAEEMGFKIIDIKQGYAKCSVCPVNENAAISADPSFIRAAEREGVECLRVTNASISLKGFDTGFFGGTFFMAGKDVCSAKGDLKKHPDIGRIEKFLEKFGIRADNKTEGLLTDFGSLSVIITREKSIID